MVRREPLRLKLCFASRLGSEDLGAIVRSKLRAVDAELAAFRDIVTSIADEAAAVRRDSGANAAIEAHDRLLLGPLITLTNGVHLATAYRDWLRRTLEAHNRGMLPASVLLTELQRIVEAP